MLLDGTKIYLKEFTSDHLNSDDYSVKIFKKELLEFVNNIGIYLDFTELKNIDNELLEYLRIYDLYNEIALNSDVVDKVNRINKIRYENSQELIAKGEESLEPYQFDYLLLCAKICGSSHYNMQMKIIVESEKDFEKWINQQQTFSEIIQ